MFNKLKNILKDKTEKFAKKLTEKEITEKDIEELFWELEISLLESNVSLEVIEELQRHIKENILGKKISSLEIKKIIKKVLRKLLESILQEDNFLKRLSKIKEKPIKIMLIGFNGSGKTTTLAKIAYLLKNQQYSIVVAAGDTYRAAAIEQLEEHSKNLGIKIIKNTYSSDSASVIYDAVSYAKAHNIDIVLADTAGRVHTNKNLIEELKKIMRVNKPHFTILVVDATTGNDAISQAKFFSELEFDGYVITKVDVDDKGGTMLNVSYAVKKPIFFIGKGQRYEDLEIFDKEKIINKILDF